MVRCIVRIARARESAARVEKVGQSDSATPPGKSGSSRSSATTAGTGIARRRASPACPRGWCPTPAGPSSGAGSPFRSTLGLGAPTDWSGVSWVSLGRRSVAGWRTSGGSCCPSGRCSEWSVPAGSWASTRSGSRCPRTTSPRASIGNGCTCIWRWTSTPMTCCTSPSSPTRTASRRRLSSGSSGRRAIGRASSSPTCARTTAR